MSDRDWKSRETRIGRGIVGRHRHLRNPFQKGYQPIAGAQFEDAGALDTPPPKPPKGGTGQSASTYYNKVKRDGSGQE